MATIFCFSATGNSLYVARKIAEPIQAKVISMSEDVSKCDDDTIGFVFPVYFWGLPKIVKQFIEQLQISNPNAYIFTIITYGGKVQGVDGAVQNLLVKKGLQQQYANTIKCVENYIPIYKVNDTDGIRRNVDENLKAISKDILEKRKSRIGKYTVINQLIYKVFPGNKGECDRFFYVEDTCNGCGMCEKVCPVSNVEIIDNVPRFKGNCEHCLACIHICSTGALQWKKKTKGKKRYLNPHITKKEMMQFNQK